MLIKTLRKHENGYGDKFKKAVGDEYEHPEPSALIQLKFVEEVSNGSDSSKDGGVQRDGRSSLPNEEVDGEEHDSASDDKKPRADKGTRKGAKSKGRPGSRELDSDIEKSDEQE